MRTEKSQADLIAYLYNIKYTSRQFYLMHSYVLYTTDPLIQRINQEDVAMSLLEMNYPLNDYYVDTPEELDDAYKKIYEKYKDKEMDYKPILKVYQNTLKAKNASIYDLGRANPNFDYRIEFLENIMFRMDIPDWLKVRNEVNMRTYTQIYDRDGFIEYVEIEKNKKA